MPRGEYRSTECCDMNTKTLHVLRFFFTSSVVQEVEDITIFLKACYVMFF